MFVLYYFNIQAVNVLIKKTTLNNIFNIIIIYKHLLQLYLSTKYNYYFRNHICLTIIECFLLEMFPRNLNKNPLDYF